MYSILYGNPSPTRHRPNPGQRSEPRATPEPPWRSRASNSEESRDPEYGRGYRGYGRSQRRQSLSRQRLRSDFAVERSRACSRRHFDRMIGGAHPRDVERGNGGDERTRRGWNARDRSISQGFALHTRGQRIAVRLPERRNPRKLVARWRLAPQHPGPVDTVRACGVPLSWRIAEEAEPVVDALPGQTLIWTRSPVSEGVRFFVYEADGVRRRNVLFGGGARLWRDV